MTATFAMGTFLLRAGRRQAPAPYCAIVPDFLSAEWMRDIEAAAPPLDPGVSFTLRQVVLGAPGGDMTCLVRIAGGRLTMLVAPDDGTSDVTIRLPYEVAVALARGLTNVHDAILDGAIKVRGDLDRLQQATATLGAVADAMGAVRARTAYPD
jgi:hypothetical protein